VICISRSDYAFIMTQAFKLPYHADFNLVLATNRMHDAHAWIAKA
jgi:hypothetical protein